MDLIPKFMGISFVLRRSGRVMSSAAKRRYLLWCFASLFFGLITVAFDWGRGSALFAEEEGGKAADNAAPSDPSQSVSIIKTPEKPLEQSSEGAAKTDSSNTPAPIADPAGRSMPKEIRILFYGPKITMTGYLVAQAEGYFQNEGVPPVSLLLLPPWSNRSDEIRKGRVEFSTVSTSRDYGFFVCDIEVVDTVLIAQIVQRSSLGVMIRTDSHPTVHSLKNLSGLAVGVSYRNDLISDAVFRYLGIDVEYVNHPNDGLFLFRKQVFDALFYSSFEGEVRQKFSRYRNVTRYFSLADRGINPPEDGLICRRQFLMNHPNLCRKVVRATFRGWIKASEDRERALDILQNYYSQWNIPFDRPLVAAELDECLRCLELKPVLENNGLLSEERFNQMKNIYAAAFPDSADRLPPFDHYFYPVMQPEITAVLARQQKEKENRENDYPWLKSSNFTPEQVSPPEQFNPTVLYIPNAHSWSRFIEQNIIHPQTEGTTGDSADKTDKKGEGEAVNATESSDADDGSTASDSLSREAAR